MNYPTLTEVASADGLQLASWFRHLPSPGSWAIGKPNFHEAHCRECDVLDAIRARLSEASDSTLAITKALSP